MNPQLEQRQWFNDTVASNAVSLNGADLPWLEQTRSEARHALDELAAVEEATPVRLANWVFVSTPSAKCL